MVTPFQALPLGPWRETRDTIAGYARFLRRIRQYNTPPQKHYWHVSLRATAAGLTTTPIRDESGLIYALEFDYLAHLLHVQTSAGERREVALHGQSVKAFKEETLAALSELGITPAQDAAEFNDNSAGAYDKTAVARFWQSLIEIDSVLKTFRSRFNEETSPVQFWAHHFDLAVLWFSGRKVPGEDPQNPEYADEQMNFGFSTGDEGFADPYFYATAYPLPEGWWGSALPSGAYWQKEGWTGAVLPYEVLVGAEDGRQQLLDFLHSAQSAGARLMRGDAG